MALRFLKKKSEFAFKLERILGFYPKHITLYRQALTHKSIMAVSNKPRYESNERLEFLGDSVISTVISSYVFKKFPYKDEGFLTQTRSKLVNRNFLNDLSLKLGVNELVDSYQVNDSKMILGDALEALIGAVYLDKGFKKAEKFIITKMLDSVSVDDVLEMETDFKTRTIHYVQKGKHKMEFETEEFEASNKKYYQTKLFIDNQLVGIGEAPNKKLAANLACEQFIRENLKKE